MNIYLDVEDAAVNDPFKRVARSLVSEIFGDDSRVVAITIELAPAGKQWAVTLRIRTICPALIEVETREDSAAVAARQALRKAHRSVERASRRQAAPLATARA